MSGRTVQDLTRSALLAGWGVATLVLMFGVGLLGYELYARGEGAARSTPLAAGLPKPSETTSPGTNVERSPVPLYFGSPFSSGLRSEVRLLDLRDDTIANIKTAFAALAAGPRSDSVPVIPSTARARAIYLMSSGDLVIDFARDVDVPAMQSASAELLMARALTLTLTQPGLQTGNTPRIQRVRFLFEGAATGSHFPQHIKLEAPMEPETAWVVPATGNRGNV